MNMQYLVIKYVVNLYLPLTYPFLKPHKHQHQIPHPLTSIPKTPQSPTSNLHNYYISIIIIYI